MTNRYSHLAPDHLRVAVGVLDGILPTRQTSEKITQEITQEVGQTVKTPQESS